jgi:hypothetical protein
LRVKIVLEGSGYSRFIFNVGVKIIRAFRLGCIVGRAEALSKMSNFCKNGSCPDSHDLLAFQNGDLEVADSVELRAHLAECEFCSAEVEFYSHYPQPEESVESPEMPKPLAELAEALLKKDRENSKVGDIMRELWR